MTGDKLSVLMNSRLGIRAQKEPKYKLLREPVILGLRKDVYQFRHGAFSLIPHYLTNRWFGEFIDKSTKD